MVALVRKETEGLAAHWVALVVLVLVNAAGLLWNPDFVLVPLGAQREGGESQSMVLFLLSFLVGHGLVAHELRDGHVEFLDALPTSRATVFAAKVVAGALPVGFLVVSSLAMDVSHGLLAQPLGSSSPVPALLVLHATMAVAGLFGLGVGMALSWIGPLAWGVLAFAAVVSTFAMFALPALRPWIPVFGSFGRLDWDGATPTHPVAPAALLVLLGLAGMALSGALFVGPGSVLTERGSSGVAAVRTTLVGCSALLLAPVVALVAFAMVLTSGMSLFQGKAAMHTPSFRVLYAPGDEARAAEVASRVDRLSRDVGALLGNPTPLSLDIELLGAPLNHLGVFTGGKIRLAKVADDATLAHELAHAHAFQLAGDAGFRQREHTHFFEEGLADWARSEVVGGDRVPLVVGAIAETGQARFEELVESTQHGRRHDLRQSYELGQAFVAALHDVAGPGAAGCLLRQLRSVGDEPVAGLALWYDLTSACDIDLDEVLDRWDASMLEARARIDGPLPRLRVKVVDGPALEVRDDEDRQWPLLCLFRAMADDPPQQWTLTEVVDGRCPVPLQALGGGSMQYQVGYVLPTDGERQAVFLEWTDAPLP